jgi:hypothetical protein
MSADKTNELYFQARDRALERLVEGGDFLDQCMKGFEHGLLASQNEMLESDFVNIKSESNYGFGYVLGVLAGLEAVKGKHYAASWQKRGELLGALPNVQRKHDRLETVMSNPPVSLAGESITETLGDLAVYAAKWAVLRAELTPEEFKKWIKGIVNFRRTEGTPNQ